MNTTDHVFEETHIAGQSRCVAETLTANGAYSHPQQLAVLQPLRARLLDPIVWGEAAVHVNFAKLHMQTAQTESGQSN